MERTFIAELDNSIRSMRGIQRVVDEISKVNFEGRVDSPDLPNSIKRSILKT
ncbi:hypothetical protein KKE34_04135 [Patescibacteria group bacterium]|nr:hypothetical protein [Patescibacteria group bacterium]MBU1885769.1 hypothetical protein [Patescibacteria group bacterium]